jgi:hypothetical protein
VQERLRCAPNLAVEANVEDYFPQGRRYRSRLHEKGGKGHAKEFVASLVKNRISGPEEGLKR